MLFAQYTFTISKLSAWDGTIDLGIPFTCYATAICAVDREAAGGSV